MGSGQYNIEQDFTAMILLESGWNERGYDERKNKK